MKQDDLLHRQKGTFGVMLMAWIQPIVKIFPHKILGITQHLLYPDGLRQAGPGCKCNTIKHDVLNLNES